MSGSRLPLFAASMVLSILLSRPARADETATDHAPPATDAQPVPLIPAATDTLGGHLRLRAGAFAAAPFGELDDSLDFADNAGWAAGVSAQLGIGLSRYVVVGAWFDGERFGEGNDTCDCKARGFGVGPFVEYHLVQGLRFDPHVALGLGYRKIHATRPSFDYSGIEWLRAELGGDWYGISQLAIGPYVGLSLGTLTERPEGRDRSIYGILSFGLRLTLDVPGK